ncbi:MAG: bifunctional alpha,alpha-trehalose-phosphate synthase (UDP-forming)/trehalose-phosphatase [Flavobacteriaceae bacterium]|nr:bifunctional alpha,alpha-trehalose-phosphate synthase (UDP-forming)/trehalose-phosphatase [Flavobacteriaceae bacterium]|tara:strand:+ start:31508 stop:33730 length:2223 start_codon:yes stop_codon:yes gene_type:complete
MPKNIIISNRLPVQISLDKAEIEITPSVGGLATGMKSIHSEGNSIWIGWSGLESDTIDEETSVRVDEALKNEKCVAVNLTAEDVEDFYLGFSNKTIWPLFHYFIEYTKFNYNQWKAYKAVNQKFAEKALEFIEDDDIIWVHDYQLMMLPELIKRHKPNATIGFFLHIPYPSHEIFRIFPWREELLKGILGSDLIGMHTYDYERHFLSSVKRILGLEVHFNEIIYRNRIIKVDSFPMGIDYKRFHDAASVINDREEKDQSELQKRLLDHKSKDTNNKLILSIDRLDYTKGIPNRIKAFEFFLDRYPEFHEKVRLVMLAVPSRSNVSQYKRLKKETDELVGRINGKFATISWTPIWYFYRSVAFEQLIELYTASDVALISPLRDGMNLVAKEYVATRTKKDGVLILSEMAGAAKELHDAILINPNNFQEFANALKTALTMSTLEQMTRMIDMQKRVKRYDVEKWASEFIKTLKDTKKSSKVIGAKYMNPTIERETISAYQKAKNRLLFIDYDGTLVGFKNDPQDAKPDQELYDLLDSLNSQENTTVVLITGRDKETFSRWFNHKDYALITDHGVWVKQGFNWRTTNVINLNWIDNVTQILESFVDRTPGTFIERKKFSVAWHYRTADEELALRRKIELTNVLISLTANSGLSVLDGNKVLEIKSSSIDKGKACTQFMLDSEYDYIIAMGDDYTDEFMFKELPDTATTIKVGLKKTSAKYFTNDPNSVRVFLKKLADAIPSKK